MKILIDARNATDDGERQSPDTAFWRHFLQASRQQYSDIEALILWSADSLQEPPESEIAWRVPPIEYALASLEDRRLAALARDQSCDVFISACYSSVGAQIPSICLEAPVGANTLCQHRRLARQRSRELALAVFESTTADIDKVIDIIDKVQDFSQTDIAQQVLLECVRAEAAMQREMSGAIQHTPAERQARSQAMQYNLKGEAAFAAGDLQGALDYFQQALQCDASLATVHNNLGVLFWSSGDRKRCLSHLKQALQMDHDDRTTIINCAEVFSAMQLYDDARMIYSMYLQNHPDDNDINDRMQALGETG